VDAGYAVGALPPGASCWLVGVIMWHGVRAGSGRTALVLVIGLRGARGGCCGHEGSGMFVCVPRRGSNDAWEM